MHRSTVPKPPPVTLLRVLDLMDAGGAVLRFDAYETRPSAGPSEREPRSGSRMRAMRGGKEDGRFEIAAATVTKARRDGFLRYEDVPGERACDAVPTEVGLRLLHDHRWRLQGVGDQEYAILKSKPWGRERAPGPILRISRRTESRCYVDRSWCRDPGDLRDLRVKGRGDRTYVATSYVERFADRPDAFVDELDGRKAIDRAIAASVLREAEAVEALPEVKALRAGHAAERAELRRRSEGASA